MSHDWRREIILMRIILPTYITEAERIAAIYGVTLDDLRKKDRCKSIVIVRKRAMKAVRDLGASLKEVGAVDRKSVV